MIGVVLRRACAVAVMIAGAAGATLAQAPASSDVIESMPIRFGPLGLSPSIAITDVGVDSNIFNESGTPRQDFTATLTPQVVARVRAGRVLLTASNATGFVYYLDFADERSVNYIVGGRADVDLGRVQPFVAADLQDTRERLNQEIDVRAGRLGWSASGGVRLVMSPRAAVAIAARLHDFEFDPGSVFNGVSLTRTLNRRIESYDAALELTLTPLTTFAITSTWQDDRFDAAPERDARSISVVPSLTFDPIALLQGSVAVGYKEFDPRSPALAGFSGVVARAAVTYTLLERTRFEVRTSRDVQYSFEETDPYYVGTGTRLQVTHRLVGPFDLDFSGGRERLAYQPLAGATTTRVDRIDVLSAGVGYRLAENARFLVMWEYTRRGSDRSDREYDRRRVVASLLYGI